MQIDLAKVSDANFAAAKIAELVNQKEDNEKFLAKLKERAEELRHELTINVNNQAHYSQHIAKLDAKIKKEADF